MPFTERSLVSSLTVPMFDRAIGLRIDSSGKNWSAQLGFYGDNIGKNGIQVNDEGWGVSSRVTFAPIMTKKHVLHVGASAGYRATSDQGTTLKYKYETTHMSNLYFTNAKVTDVDGVTLADVEAAYMFGPFSVQAEYAHTWIEREGMGGVDFGAYYVQAAWTLTGESRNYKGAYGKFKRLKPTNEFSWSKGTWGAVELATRFDGNDLTSGDVHGGEEHAVTVALNWYLNQNVRLMADYRHAFKVTNSAVKDVDGSEIDGGTHDFTFRTQVTF
ncbi:MAG: porin, partial [Methyloprofundus sp.]|nr:porin [Methyloprofundus sp.]